MNNFIRGLFLLILSCLAACSQDFPVLENLQGSAVHLVNQDSSNVIFPDDFKGQTLIVGYIFTNCPDICPLTTNNMRLIQERLAEENLKNIHLISITFDPEVDKPSVLKSFAQIRNLDLRNWDFLTGKKKTIDSLMRKSGIVAVPGDSTQFENGEKIIYYVHTDRISIVDVEQRVRKNYPGSNINVDEIINDLKDLAD